MKRIALLLILFLGGVNLYSQTETDKKNLIETNLAFGVGNYNSSVSRLGEGSYDTKYYYSMGLNYSRKLFKRWDLCSGIEYTYNNMMLSYFDYDINERIKKKGNLKLVTIPAQFKFDLGKLVYFNGGLLFNIFGRNSFRARVAEVSPDGTFHYINNNVKMLLGCSLGVGFKHEFDSGIVISLNPYARWNGIGKERKYYPPPIQTDYRFLQGGVNLGVGYKF